MNRLLICTPSYHLHGGLERILESLAARLPAHGFEVIVGLARGAIFHDPERYRAEYPDLISVDLDGTGGTSTARQAAIRSVIRDVDPDVVLIARLFDAYPAVAAAKTSGHRLRLAVTIQAYEAEYFVDAHRYREFVDLCVTSGKLIAAAASEISGIPASRVVSIPGGVMPARKPRTAANLLRIGYVGRIETLQKRTLDLVETLTRFRDQGHAFHCVVAGAGTAETELRQRINAHGLSDMVTFRGWLDTDQLYEEIYPALDVLLHFAEWEGITIAPREAMANGVVPVVSRFIGLREEGQIVDGLNALTFPVGDTSAAADCISRLDRDRELLRRLSDNAAMSQTGINSEDGAVAAWAHSLRSALEREPRIGPPLQVPPPSGRLGRFLSARVADRLRRALGRSYRHADAGSEWPHWSGVPDDIIAARVQALPRERDATARTHTMNP